VIKFNVLFQTKTRGDLILVGENVCGGGEVTRPRGVGCERKRVGVGGDVVGAAWKPVSNKLEFVSGSSKILDGAKERKEEHTFRQSQVLIIDHMLHILTLL
jgi:hypothetical protein